MGMLHSALKMTLCSEENTKMIFWKVLEANARESISFSNASCTLTWYKYPGLVPAALFFRDATNMLELYCSKEDPSIPEGKIHQELLLKLLKYLTSDHGQLMYQESRKEANKVERNWAIIVAQHLLTELTMEEECLTDNRYTNINPGMTTCVCAKQDDFKGKFADTSFGCVEAWLI